MEPYSSEVGIKKRKIPQINRSFFMEVFNKQILIDRENQTQHRHFRDSGEEQILRDDEDL